MSTQTVSGSQIANAPESLRGINTIWASGTTRLLSDSTNNKSSTIPIRTATIAATGLTYAFQVDSNGNLDYNKIVAQRRGDSAVWEPTTYANTLGTDGSFSRGISSQTLISSGLESTSKSAISSGLRQSTGRTPTDNEISQVRSGGVQSGALSGSVDPSLRPQGGTPPPGQTGGEADVAGTLGEVRTTITSLQDIAFNITGESAQKRDDAAKGLTYPETFPTGMDYIQFSSKTYGRKSFDSKKFKLGERTNGSTEEFVILPLQSGLSDANTVGWNEETFNPAQLVGANLAISGISQGTSGFISTLKEVTNKLGAPSNKGNVEQAIIAYFAEQAIGTQVLSRLGGAVFNPNTELLFQGPQLRAFNFSFKLTPRTDTEAAIVRKIIGFFKRNMAPQTVESGLYLKAPKIFSINYSYNGQKSPHPGIGLIKDCALQSCNVEYTPDGSYMTFEDGSMVSYNLSLQFMELEPIYSKDYDDKNAATHSIGY